MRIRILYIIGFCAGQRSYKVFYRGKGSGNMERTRVYMEERKKREEKENIDRQREVVKIEEGDSVARSLPR